MLANLINTLPNHVDRELEWFLFASFAVVGALVALAQRVRVPYPIFLVMAGLAMGFAPHIPQFELNPRLVFLIFLPPLVYGATYFTSLSDLRENRRSVSLLAFGLVLCTMATVGFVAHAAIHLGWGPAFVLGALVSPTDPIAASSIMQRLNVPSRVVAILEGESLLNDGTGIVVFRVAVAGVVSGSFHAGTAALSFAWSVVGGVAIGAAVGLLLTWVRRSNRHGSTDVLLSLLSGFVAYLPADALGASGVLAAVTCAIWLGWNTPKIVRDPETRLQIHTIWTNVSFMLNTLLFLLVGLQLHRILRALQSISDWTLLGYGATICATVIVTRLVWVWPSAYAPRWLDRRFHMVEPYPPWQQVTIIGWVGMRGAITLAAALSLPDVTNALQPFPDRDLLVYLAFATILGTLVLQGLTLPMLLRRLGASDADDVQRAEAHARASAARAAVARIDELADEDWVRDDTAERLRNLYGYRIRRFGSQVRGNQEASSEYELRSANYQRLLRQAHAAERARLIELRDAGEISDAVRVRVERDLDLEDARLEGFEE